MMDMPVFQIAYVTADLAAAAGAFGAWFGAKGFRVDRDVSIETSLGIARCHFALAFLGDLQIELIEPAGGADGVYRDGIEPRVLAKHHHLGFLIRSEDVWLRTLRDIEGTGRPIPVRGNFHDLMHYAYLDRRDLFGHYLEYMYPTQAGANLFDDVPRFPAVNSPLRMAIPA